MNLKAIIYIVSLYYFSCAVGDNVDSIKTNFINNGNGTVTDKKTGYTWTRCSINSTNDVECSDNFSYGMLSSSPNTERRRYNWNDSFKGCKQLSLAGKKWKLPTVAELSTLLKENNEKDKSLLSSIFIQNEFIDNKVFPNSKFSYWTNEEKNNYNSPLATYINFYKGEIRDGEKNSLKDVRCIEKIRTTNFNDNNNGTVTDRLNELIWQKCTIGQNNDSTCTGNGKSYGWKDANNACNTLKLAGRKWRLPTSKELTSLLDKELDPAIDLTIFPNTEAESEDYSSYWTSDLKDNKALSIYFGIYIRVRGKFKEKDEDGYTRCVSGI
jgi:hypothetical protein